MRLFWLICTALTLSACTGDENSDDDDTETDEETDTDTDSEDDSVWKNRSIETSTTLNAVYTSGTGAWVFGGTGAGWRISQGSAETINLEVSDDLRGVFGTTSEALTVVGYSGTVVSVSDDLSSTVVDIGTANLNDVDGTSSDLTAVGRAGVYRMTGGEWAFEHAAFGGALNDVYIRGDEAWAVGDAGLVMKRDSDGWQRVAMDSNVNLHGIYGGAGMSLWIVGDLGTVLYHDGEIWTDRSIVAKTNLWSVWVGDDGHPIVVGSNGTALKWNPELGGEDTDISEGFEEMNTGITNNLYRVFGSDVNNVWAVGNRGTVLRYTGGSE